MKTLYLLRHAQAVPPGTVASDFERPLTPAGIAAAQRMADVMASRGWRPEAVLCSAAHRALQTWETMAPKLAPDAVPQVLPALYLAPPHRLLAALRQQTGDRASTLLVAHNPGIHSLALTLASPDSANAAIDRRHTDYPPAALSVFDLPIDDWGELAPQVGQMAHFLGPGDLP